MFKSEREETTLRSRGLDVWLVMNAWISLSVSTSSSTCLFRTGSAEKASDSGCCWSVSNDFDNGWSSLKVFDTIKTKLHATEANCFNASLFSLAP